MSIKHDPHPAIEPDEAFKFADLFGMSVSICAPTSWTKEQVEQFANEDGHFVKAFGPLQAIDKSELGWGSPTPNPCNHDPLNRKHWFLLR